jgi:hypothetical protein
VDDARIELLARRVRWLEGKRKTIRMIVIAAVSITGLIFEQQIFGDTWPKWHARLSMIGVGFGVAFVLDLGVVGLLALWETKHSQLLRERGLPRAILRK